MKKVLSLLLAVLMLAACGCATVADESEDVYVADVADAADFIDLAAEKAQEENGFCEYVILRAEKDENGEDSLVTIDDDEEFDDVADYFDDLFSEEIDYDATEN